MKIYDLTIKVYYFLSKGKKLITKECVAVKKDKTFFYLQTLGTELTSGFYGQALGNSIILERELTPDEIKRIEEFALVWKKDDLKEFAYPELKKVRLEKEKIESDLRIAKEIQVIVDVKQKQIDDLFTDYPVPEKDPIKNWNYRKNGNDFNISVYSVFQDGYRFYLYSNKYEYKFKVFDNSNPISHKNKSIFSKKIKKGDWKIPFDFSKVDFLKLKAVFYASLQ